METDLELIEGLVEDFAKFKSKQNTTYQEIQEELAAKGATLKEIMEQLQQIQAKGGMGQKLALLSVGEQSTYDVLKEAFAKEHGAILQKAKSEFERHKFETKSVGVMTASANLTGSVIANYAQQPAARMRRKIHFRDLVSVVPSSTGVWKFYRSNTPTGEGSFGTTNPGDAKSQLDYDLTEVVITTAYLAGYVRIAKEMIQDLPFLQSFVTNELIEDYLRAEDNKYFGQLYSAATGAAGTSTVTAEKIIQTIAALREADQDPNGIVVTNAVWAKLLNTKPNDYSIPGGVTITPDGNIAIAGIPVIPTVESNIGTNRMLIGDWSKANIIQTEGLSVNLYEQDGDNVTKNLVTARAEARTALAVLRPEAFTYTTAGTT
jgi:HK97 family phage major capsid protein